MIISGDALETLFVILSGDDSSVEVQGVRLTFESAEQFATEVMAHQTYALHVHGWQVRPIPKASDVRQWWRETERHGTRWVRIDEVAVQE